MISPELPSRLVALKGFGGRRNEAFKGLVQAVEGFNLANNLNAALESTTGNTATRICVIQYIGSKTIVEEVKPL
jgi:hypothetical protein